jgi:hypothetical protein
MSRKEVLMNGNTGGDPERKAPEVELARQASMIDLLEHLLDQYWGMAYQSQGHRPQLLPGEMPDKLPVDLSFPEGSRIVGSIQWAQQTSIIFDCSMTREEVLQFYEEQLLSQGWTKPEMPFPLGGVGGFTRNWPDTHTGISFCSGERGPSLNVRAFNSSDRTTSVHVTLNTDSEQSPCSPRRRRQYGRMDPGLPAVLPEMRHPAGATQLGGGGSGGGPDNVHSEAWLKTDLDLHETLAYYSEQLARAGWAEASSGQNGPIGWSTWDFSFESEQWHGMLTITERPWSTGDFRLRLYAEVEGFGQHGGIMFVGHF